jgi:uncharacterized protein
MSAKPCMADDAARAAAQVGRPLRAPACVGSRCPLGLPVVLQVPPQLDTGEPFPTHYWLTCPLLHRRVASLEAAGGVREAERWVEADRARAASLAAAHARYSRDRDRQLPPETPHRPKPGVGGTTRGVKCLHAHLADHLAGNANPVGAWVARRVGPPSCHVACVVAGPDGHVVRNPAWRRAS